MYSNKKVPLIKEYRVDKLKSCLKCIDKYPFNRDKQKECILNLYSGKSEKSVFRGMVIPSLRHLGLILGYRDFLRVSANGKLMIESELASQNLQQRVLGAVIYEIDQNIFKFIDVLRNNDRITTQNFLQIMNTLIDAPSEKQKKERISHWLSVLKEVELINYDTRNITLNEHKYKQTLSDVDVSYINVEDFKKYLFDIYSKLSKKMAGIIDIADLRENVAVNMLRYNKIILTENQFDKMLRKIPFSTDDYIISFGRPMGAEEKLFEHNSKYFRTLSIQFLKR
ncbi:MAG: hypothetical protein KAW87_02675 [Candidatus Cloacimonetes bacterium]|nr:hypothetical protein [Candidatus Cloacimonadota bacterium]